MRVVGGLTRFWIELDYSGHGVAPGTDLGVGVTAIDRGDALRLVAHRVFDDAPLPPVKSIRENVDVSTLDQRYVLPNIGPPHVRGVWFPKGY
jgi:hypothetical protein